MIHQWPISCQEFSVYCINSIYEQLKQMKEKKKLTTQQISDKSGIPTTTVHRILSGETENPTFQNIRDLVIALDGSLDELAGIKRPEAPSSNNDMAIKILEKSIEDKDRWIMRLFIVLVALIAVFIVLIIFDVMHGGIGYVRY